MESTALRVVNPFDGSVIGTVRNMGVDEVREVIMSCTAARESLPAHERAACLRRAAQSIEQAAGSWALLITRESGLSLWDMRREVSRLLEVIEWGAVTAVNGRGETWISDIARNLVNRICAPSAPMPDAVLVVTPFNHPHNQIVHKIVPAVAAGARVILKPSEKTPLTAIRFLEELRAAGLPANQVQIITGDPRVLISTALACNEITALAFTGSTKVGRQLGFMAGPRRMSLEWGSIDSAIVLDSADIEETAKPVLHGAFANSSQRCMAVKRIVVVDEITDNFVAAMADQISGRRFGVPLDEDIWAGTIIDVRAAEAAVTAVKTAACLGARIFAGGDHDGVVVYPTLIDRCQLGMPLVDMEVFAPLAPVIRVRDIDEAIATANSGPYELSCGHLLGAWRMQFGRRAKCVPEASISMNSRGWRLEVTPSAGSETPALKSRRTLLG